MHIRHCIPVLILVGILLKILLPHTDKLTIPVTIYMAIILFMLWQAIERWGLGQSRSATFARIGALLFVLSDSILAYNRFVKSFKIGCFVVLSSYYCAQWFIASSV